MRNAKPASRRPPPRISLIRMEENRVVDGARMFAHRDLSEDSTEFAWVWENPEPADAKLASARPSRLLPTRHCPNPPEPAGAYQLDTHREIRAPGSRRAWRELVNAGGNRRPRRLR